MTLTRYSTWVAGIAIFSLALIVILVMTLLNSAPTAESVGQSQHYELPPAETEWLWELEHAANILNASGFSQLKSALTTADRPALLKLLSSDFQGSVLANPATVVFSSESVSAVRSEGTGSPTSVSSEGLIDELLRLRSLVGELRGCSIGVKRIGPIARENPNSNWVALCEMWMRGQSQGRLVEVTTLFEMQTAKPDATTMASTAWINQLEIIETSVSDSARPMFEDFTSRTGIDTALLHDNWDAPFKINNPGGVYACDFNRDGRTDFLVTDSNPIANALYQAVGDGTFEDVTNRVGLGLIKRTPLSRGNAIFADLNNDGWIDLIHTEGAIWENREGKEFVNRAAESNFFTVTDHLKHELKSISVADFDRDGLLDLYVLRRHEMPTSWLIGKGDGPGNVLCRNLGDWQFEDVTTQSGTDGDNSLIFTTVWLDANNDNWPDISVINEFGDSFLYINKQNGQFGQRDVTPSKADFGSMGVDVGDIDNDGFIDIYVAGMYSKAGSRVIGNLSETAYPEDVMNRLHSLIDGSELYRNKGDLEFEASGEKDRVHNVGWSWGPTLADFNNDGCLDIYAPAGYMSRDRTKPDG